MPGSITSTMHQRDGAARDLGQRLLGRLDGGDVIALELQVVGEQRPHLRLVFDDEHFARGVGGIVGGRFIMAISCPGACAVAGRSATAGSMAASGKMTRNVLPRPSVALDLDAAAMGMDQLLHDRAGQGRSPRDGPRPPLPAIELVEDPAAVGLARCRCRDRRLRSPPSRPASARER